MLKLNEVFSIRKLDHEHIATGNETKCQNCAESSRIINHGPAHRLHGDDFSVVKSNFGYVFRCLEVLTGRCSAKLIRMAFVRHFKKLYSSTGALMSLC